jgi:putative ABC transport system permease protein
LSEHDVETQAPVAVLGAETARQLFPARDAVGQDFRVDQQVLRVIGVLQEQGLSGGAGGALVGRDLNRDIHLPLTTAERQFGDVIQRRTSGSFTTEEIQLSEIYVTAPSTMMVNQISQRVERIMATGHPGMSDVQIVVPWELLENARRAMLVWNVMLVAIAAISLLVGGIGIMNIMLASVTERTREIGIRRALGATRRHIILQFLVETGSLSAVGGLLGIILGISASIGLGEIVPVVQKWQMFRGVFGGGFSLQPIVTGWSIIVSFGVAAAVGLVFGMYPAIVASRKDPVVALRHD